MDDLITLIKNYRFTEGWAERVRLVEKIIHHIEPDLRLYVVGRVSQQAAKDVLQEVLIAVATSLKTFKGDTAKEFWKWCYGVTKFKIYDQINKEVTNKIQFVPPEDLWQMMDLSAQDMPMSPATRHDLEYVMKLLTASKPECSDFLWDHFVFERDYADIAEERGMSYDAARVRINRCLDEAKSLVS